MIASRGELMEMPAKPVLNSRALSDEVLSVSYEEAHLATGTVQRRGRQVAEVSLDIWAHGDTPFAGARRGGSAR